MHVFVLPFWFNLGFLVLAVAMALASGDRRAIAIAGVQVGLELLGIYVNQYSPCRFNRCYVPHPPLLFTWRFLLEDPIQISVCVACAWRAQRYWVIGAASVAVLIFFNDAALAMVPHVSAWASVSANLVFLHAINLLVIIGAWPSVRRRVGAVLARGRACTSS